MTTTSILLSRIKYIDQAFETTKGWGSWMVTASLEREQLVNKLRAEGVSIEHKYLTKDAAGGKIID